ncbi:hypothetical protein OAA99_00885, partial [Omnitrophica bacterium]|nr:hypothetical protein [Candidatus Omnitrophota bacterium]
TPTVQEFNINIDEKYENITNPYALVSLIIVKSLAGTTIARLADIDLRGLQTTISDTFATAGEAATEAAAQAEVALKESAQKTNAAARQAAKKTEEAAKEAAASIKKTTEELKDKFKLPFGETE